MTLKTLKYALFDPFPGLFVATFRRQGGQSLGPYASLNLSYDVGDDNAHVDKNIAQVKDTIACQSLQWATQVHGLDIVEVKSPFEVPPVCDVLTTKTKGIALMIKHADCQAAVLFDPKNQAVSLVHAGWRGSCLDIYRHAVRDMQGRYGTLPKDLLVSISPSLGPKAAEFKNYHQEFPESFLKYKIDACHFDFWAITQSQLEKAGVFQVEIARICTVENEEDFFSYRREKVTGRSATVACLM